MSQSNDATKVLKKKIIVIGIIIGACMIMIYGLSSMISFNLEDFLYEEVNVGNSILPYEPDFNENIFEDEDYLDLDRNIYYTESSTGMTVSIDESNYSKYSDAVVFMFEYINSIIGGQTNFYNNCYNDLYIQAVGKQSEFTMQKLYDIEFCILHTGTDSASGKDYVKLWLDYKIMENNITLRNDIGSNVSRRQYITLVKEKNEENDLYKIQAVEYENVKPEKTLILSRAIALLVVAVAVIASATAVIVVMIVRKKKRKKQTEN